MAENLQGISRSLHNHMNMKLQLPKEQTHQVKRVLRTFWTDKDPDQPVLLSFEYMYICNCRMDNTPQPLYNTIVGVHSINHVS